MHALAMADDANREPGAPIGKDEIDPDLIRLPRGALQVGIIAAVGVLILCVALLVRLRHDVGYARESDTPKAVTAADIVAGKVDDNRYVTVEAPPDRAGAVRLRTTKGSDGHRVVAVRGTSDRLWLALPGDAWGHEAQHDDRVSGRLRRLADVRYAGPLARALAAYPSPRFITGAELRRARTENASQVTLIDGATRLQILTRIILPLAVPGLISAGIFAFTLSWNEFIYALTFISSSEVKTVPVGVITELVEGDVYHWGSLMAGALLGSLPVAVLYSFFVEYYVSGLTGAVKE